MTKREEEVLKLIEENPMISQKECAILLGISRSAVAGHIMNLTDKGYIQGKGYILREEPYAVVIGGANIDILGKPEKKFVARDSNPGRVSISPGGVGRNIAENLARLGVPVKLLSVIGNDMYGRQLLDSGRNAGLDMNHIKISSSAGTSVYLSILDGNGDMISAVSDMTLMDELDEAYLEKHHRIINSASLIVVDANLSEGLLNHITSRYGDKDIFVDTVSTAKAGKIEPMVGRFHTIKPNRLEAEILSGISITDRSRVEEAAKVLIGRGLKKLYLSLGDQGMFFSDGERTLTYRRDPIDAVNTTGAGDAYTAALAYCHMMNYGPEKTLAFAAAASEMTVLCRDTINRNINADRIEEMIKEVK